MTVNHQSMKDPIFAGKAPFRRGFRSYEAIFWHTSAILQHSEPLFAAAKWLRSIKTPNFATKAPFRRVFCSCEMAAKHKNSQFRSQSSISQGISKLRNHFLAHECHLEAPYTHFVAAKWLRNDLQASKWLRNDLQASKWLRNHLQA